LKPVILRSALSQARTLVLIALVVALIAFALALRAFLDPQATTGKRLLDRLLIYLFGPAGPSILWFAIGVAALMIARFAWRRAPLRPSERLFW
jgi:hypothetical protein